MFHSKHRKPFQGSGAGRKSIHVPKASGADMTPFTPKTAARAPGGFSWIKMKTPKASGFKVSGGY